MPRKEDIEKFKEALNSLGGEPEILERKSQAIEDVRPPEDALPEGLDDLLGVGSAPGGPSPAPSEEPSAAVPGEPSEEPAPDFGLDLSNLEDLDLGGELTPSQEPEAPGEAAEPSAPEEPALEQPASGEPPADEAALDFGSLFGEESANAPIEDLGDLAAGPQEGQAEQGETAADQFSLPESEAASLQSDLSQMEVLPEDLGELPVPSAEAEPGAPSPEEGLSMEPPSEETLAGIELPNLEDLSLNEPLAGLEAQEPSAGAEEPLAGTSGEEPLPPPREEAPEAGQSLEDFSLGGEAPSEAELPAMPMEAPAEGPAEPPGELPSEPLPGGEELANLNLEDFSFAEPGGQLAAEEQLEAEAAAPGPAPRPQARKPERPARPSEEAAPLPELGGAEREISLTQEQFNRLKKTLAALPRNLKMAVQEVIGEGKAAGANLARLVSLLVAGASAQQIAAVVTRITGRRIAIPAG